MTLLGQVIIGANSNLILYVSYGLEYEYSMEMEIIGSRVSNTSYTLDDLLDGGEGIDWIIIGVTEQSDYGVTYELNSSPTLGFENIQGTKQNDILTGTCAMSPTPRSSVRTPSRIVTVTMAVLLRATAMMAATSFNPIQR